MNLKTKLLILALLLLSGTNFSQTDSIDHSFKHHIGISAGMSTGYGVTYRLIPKKIGFQTAFSPSKSSSILELNMGLTILYKLIETEFVNLLLYQGNMYKYEKTETHTHSVISTDPYILYETEGHSINDYFNHSIGFGFEYIFQQRISFNVMGGFGFFENFELIGLSFETGLFYRF